MQKNRKKQGKQHLRSEGGKKGMKEQVELTCVAMNEEGRGIAKHSGSDVIIQGMITGEVAIVELTRRRGFYTGKIVKLLSKSKDRVQPPCPYYEACGGCQLQHLSYEGQALYKHDFVSKLMTKYGYTEPILKMETPFAYRNKCQAAFGEDKRGNIISGIYQEYSHRLVSIERCLIQDPQADAIINTIRGLMPSFKMRAYNEDFGKGFLRHVLVRKGFASGEIMVVMVVTEHKFQFKNHFIEALLKVHPEITTVVMNINDRDTNMVLGNAEKVLYGKGFIKDTLCGIEFTLSPRSFYQINPAQTARLYQRAIEMAALTGKETVIDAYSGIGTISLSLAKKAKQVIGVELNKDAVKDAINNAKNNKINNVRFVQGDAGAFMVKMADHNEKVDVVFMDPPRGGSDERFLASVAKLKPEKIVYISCNPVTQKRDLEYLIGRGYKVEEIQPVDMFPHTFHVETVVKLQRQNP
ncbi:MAG: 23S rRNA (uracil(1939)-C(5))-methyltransferase RlmD [Clostridia bacterium]|nr:23S rRNA (uracil(1939)-C(5))-methyltransferase RlmD [Clostridia bacterium]